MDFNWNVLRISILFSASLALSSEFPLRHVETSADLPVTLTYSDWLSSVGQRTRRRAESDSTEDYETESSQEECQCPPEPPSRGSSDRRQGYPRQSGYDNGGSRRGYHSRRRGSSWWFDDKDDYADDILAYRFYNGGYSPSSTETENGTGRRRYQQGSSGSGYLGGRPVGGSSSGRSGSRYPSRRRGSSWWFDGRNDYADEILVYRFYNGRDNSNFRNIPSRRGLERAGGSHSRTGARESDYSEIASEYDSEGEFTEYESSESGTSESTNKRKVKTFRYITGVLEVDKGDDVEESSPPSKYRRIGSTRRSDKSLIGTIAPSPPAAAHYNQDNCCYQRDRRGSGYNAQRYTTESPNKFFRILWTKILDYIDDSEEDSDGRSINIDMEKDRQQIVKNSEEQAAAVVGEEVVEREAGTETNVEEVTMTPI